MTTACVVCSTLLEPPDHPPHCQDCVVEDHHHEAWLDAEGAAGGRWTRCDDLLPPESQEVLFWYDLGHDGLLYGVGYRIGESWDWPGTMAPTHWMPLPPTPAPD